jgi:hypothetical protein
MCRLPKPIFGRRHGNLRGSRWATIPWLYGWQHLSKSLDFPPWSKCTGMGIVHGRRLLFNFAWMQEDDASTFSHISLHARIDVAQCADTVRSSICSKSLDRNLQGEKLYCKDKRSQASIQDEPLVMSDNPTLL